MRQSRFTEAQIIGMIKDIGQRNRDELKNTIRTNIREVRDEYEPPMIPLKSDYDNDDWVNDLMR